MSTQDTPTGERVSAATSYPRVGIIILNWNGGTDIIACLASLTRLDYPSLDIVIVDNGSTDGSTEVVRRQFPDVTLIENGRNLGFAAGNNVGIACLMRRSVDYVLLLNDDTEVAPDMLPRLVEAAESNRRIGIAGPTIYYYDRPDVIWSAGGAVDPYGQSRHLGVDLPDSDAPEVIRDVDYVTGCAILVKRAVIEAVGPLDERFFAYFEETEWCARARRAGYRVVYVPQAKVWHKIQPAARTRSRLYLYLMARNRLLYLRCSGAPPWIIAHASASLLRTAISWSLQSRYKEMRPYAGLLLRAIADFTAGRFGAPPASL